MLFIGKALLFNIVNISLDRTVDAVWVALQVVFDEFGGFSGIQPQQIMPDQDLPVGVGAGADAYDGDIQGFADAFSEALGYAFEQ